LERCDVKKKWVQWLLGIIAVLVLLGVASFTFFRLGYSRGVMIVNSSGRDSAFFSRRFESRMERVIPFHDPHGFIPNRFNVTGRLFGLRFLEHPLFLQGGLVIVVLLVVLLYLLIRWLVRRNKQQPSPQPEQVVVQPPEVTQPEQEDESNSTE
jgi:uncharacterized membrane protein